MTRDQWPSWYEDFGAPRISQISAEQRPAAIRAAREPKCDSVESLAMDRSTPTDIGFDVDCKNGQRIRIYETDLRSVS
ncbi:hypothetical protein EWE75_12065 [Sphingomonas populi]|uniref:Uncharacterized protein n=1 Tax=Sphingomonas populi TaxID=2484750 RepID=A0A4Q6Y3A4_9SPHN|nr:hypothetical protein [Sphingomonas populi]RZF64274.1 hypothetical protein EWE75_12065 [Sphingomonas populi]